MEHVETVSLQSYSMKVTCKDKEGKPCGWNQDFIDCSFDDAVTHCCLEIASTENNREKLDLGKRTITKVTLKHAGETADITKKVLAMI